MGALAPLVGQQVVVLVQGVHGCHDPRRQPIYWGKGEVVLAQGGIKTIRLVGVPGEVIPQGIIHIKLPCAIGEGAVRVFARQLQDGLVAVQGDGRACKKKGENRLVFHIVHRPQQ